MFFMVQTPEGYVAVEEATFFAAIKRYAVHADPCAEYQGYSFEPERTPTLAGASIEAWYSENCDPGTVTAADCWKTLIQHAEGLR